MKKTYKIISTVLALIICASVMCNFVFAYDVNSLTPYATDACPDHPDAGWGTRG